MQQPAPFPLVTRRWAWLWIAVTVICAFRFVGLLQDGRVAAAVYWAATGLVGTHLLVRSFRPRRQPTADQARRRALVAALQLIIFCLAVGTVATVRAAQVSAGDRIVAIVFAVIFFGLAVRYIVKTVVGYTRLAVSGDTANAQGNGRDPKARRDGFSDSTEDS